MTPVSRGRVSALLIALALAACQPREDSAVFTGATIIAVPGTVPIENGELVVTDGRITCVGTAGTCVIPPEATRVDVRDKWMIPGLADTHVHIWFEGAPDRASRDQELRFLLGVTLTRDAGTAANFEGNIRAARRGSDARRPLPRVLVAGTAPKDRIDAGEPIEPVIAALAAGRASAIKIHDRFTAPQLHDIAMAAHDHGLQAYGHYWADGPIRSLLEESLDAGLDGLSHLLGVSPLPLSLEARTTVPDAPGSIAWRVWRRSLWLEAPAADYDSIARGLAERGIWLEPLLVDEHRWGTPYEPPNTAADIVALPFVARALDPGPTAELSEGQRERLRRSGARIDSFIRTFHEAGGVLVTGSDGTLAPGLAIHEEMRLLNAAGLSPADALAAATVEPARILGVADSLGTLETGKLADFLVLDADPLRQITNTLRIHRVVKAGVVYDPRDLLRNLSR